MQQSDKIFNKCVDDANPILIVLSYQIEVKCAYEYSKISDNITKLTLHR